MLSLSHATKAKKLTKKREAHAENMFCLSKKCFFRSEPLHRLGESGQRLFLGRFR